MGEILRGYLIKPTALAHQRLPVVILAHGFSSTQEMGLIHTAWALCNRAGIAALTFDHAGFGLSGGKHRAQDRWSMTVGFLDSISYLI